MPYNRDPAGTGRLLSQELDAEPPRRQAPGRTPLTPPDLRECAAIASRHDVPFDAVVARRERGETDPEKLAGRRLPGRDWVTTDVARALLCTTVANFSTLTSRCRGAIRQRSRSLTASSCRSVGALWCREDVEAVVRIKRECLVPLSVACRVLLALREGRLP